MEEKFIKKQEIITESLEKDKHSIKIESMKNEEVKKEATANKTAAKDNHAAIKVETESNEEKVENKDKTENLPAVAQQLSKSPVIPRRRDIITPSSVIKVPPSPTLSRPPPPPPSRKPPPPPMSPPPIMKEETTTEKLLETTTARLDHVCNEATLYYRGMYDFLMVRPLKVISLAKYLKECIFITE